MPEKKRRYLVEGVNFQKDKLNVKTAVESGGTWGVS